MATSDEPNSDSERIALLEARLRRRDRELQAIHRMMAALSGRTKLGEVEREALNVAIEVVNATGGTIYVHDPDKKVLVFRYVVGASPEITKKLLNMEMPDNKGIAGDVFHSPKGRITADVSKDANHSTDIDGKTRFVTKSMVTVPLKKMGEGNIGVFQILNKQQDDFDEEDLALLEILGAQAGTAIQNAQLFEEARRASVINLIGDISHDVKNLITPVVTGTQTLELMMDSMFEDLAVAMKDLEAKKLEEVDWAIGGVRDFYKEAMSMVYDGARDSQERVREIADAIKGVISKPHYEMSDFRERAEAVAKVLRMVADPKGIGLDLSGIQETGPVELDRKGIYNLIYNLINNAIPETPVGGTISVRTQAIDFNGQPGLQIQFADTGRGMPEHVRSKMFTDDAVSTKPGGTGLGTRIVKNVVDAHNGTIRVDSEAGRGTTFTIQIPMRQPRGEQVEGDSDNPLEA